MSVALLSVLLALVAAGWVHERRAHARTLRTARAFVAVLDRSLAFGDLLVDREVERVERLRADVELLRDAS